MGRVGRAAYELTGPGGRFFSYGSAGGEFPVIDPQEAKERKVRVFGIDDPLSPDEWRRFTEQGLKRLASGSVRPAIGQAVPMERAAEAHAAIEAREVIGKTVLTT